MDKMTKQSVIGMILFFLSISTNTFAYDVEIEGIYYNLNTNAKTAEVTYKEKNSATDHHCCAIIRYGLQEAVIQRTLLIHLLYALNTDFCFVVLELRVFTTIFLIV